MKLFILILSATIAAGTLYALHIPNAYNQMWLYVMLGWMFFTITFQIWSVTWFLISLSREPDCTDEQTLPTTRCTISYGDSGQ